MLGSVEPRLIRRGVSLATLFTTVLLLFDLNRDAERCEQECFGTYRTYEPGHAWTNYPDSWQWDAQNAIMGVAFLLARGRVPVPARVAVAAGGHPDRDLAAAGRRVAPVGRVVAADRLSGVSRR